MQTSDAFKSAGTDSNVYVQLVGKDGVHKTAWHKLDLWFTDDFQVGAENTYEVVMNDVGLPSVLNISELFRIHFLNFSCSYTRRESSIRVVLRQIKALTSLESRF